MQKPINLSLDDPQLKAADQVVRKLAERGITVFHNPSYGIMLMGARPDSPSPDMRDMDEAYALHNEIAMLFAIQSVSKIAQSMAGSRALLQRLCGGQESKEAM